MYLSPTANGWEINSHKSKYPDIKNTTGAANTYLCLQHFLRSGVCKCFVGKLYYGVDKNRGSLFLMVKLVAFDFDGTIADSVEFCLAVFDIVFKKHLGDSAPDREAIYRHFGMNEPGVLRSFIGDDFTEAEQDFYRLHRELHARMCPEIFPGCRELFDLLKSRNIKIALLTGRSEETCRISLDFLGLSDLFCSIQTGSPEKNDKSAQLSALARNNMLENDELIYIGDAESDVEACRKAGVKCLSAAWAASARTEALEKINPQLVFKSVGGMTDYIKSYIL